MLAVWRAYAATVRSRGRDPYKARVIFENWNKVARSDVRAAMPGQVTGHNRLITTFEIVRRSDDEGAHFGYDGHRDHVGGNRLDVTNAGVDPLAGHIDQRIFGDDFKLHFRITAGIFQQKRFSNAKIA